MFDTGKCLQERLEFCIKNRHKFRKILPLVAMGKKGDEKIT